MVSGPGKIGRRSLGWEGFRVRVWTRFSWRREKGSPGQGGGGKRRPGAVREDAGRQTRRREGEARREVDRNNERPTNAIAEFVIALN